MRSVVFLVSIALLMNVPLRAEQPPNVILIFADDLGPGMLGCYGQKLVKTPHIDALASEGIRFTNYYGGVYCAPSRWSLLTGMHDGRRGGWNQTRPGLPIYRDAGNITEQEYQTAFEKLKASANPIEDDEIFLGQIAQEAGYTTAQFGKLDRGFLTWDERVRRFGWDFHEGYYDHQRCHGFYPPYLWRNGVRFDLPGNSDARCGKTAEGSDDVVGVGGQIYSQNVFIEGILKFIREHKEEPFFLYHPTQLPHGPVAIPKMHPDFVDHPTLTIPEKTYASMVKMLDDHVGLIMAELKKLGLDENTIVFFCSDNGHELYYGPKADYKKQRLPGGQAANLTNRKWRTSECGDVFDGAGGRAGLKRSGYQGGMQCPMIVRWPKRIASGIESDLLAAHYDFMATLADLVDVQNAIGKDGISYLPTLLSKDQSQTHEYVIVNNQFGQMGRAAIISRGGWKLIELDRQQDRFQLYNITVDNEERHELSAVYPEKVLELKTAFLREIDSPRPDLSVH